MSIAVTTTKVSYVVSSLTQAMPTVFPFQQNSDIAVYDGATLLTLGADYSLSGGGYNGSNQMQAGTVTLISGGPASVIIGETITIYRAPSPVQETSFLSTGLQTPLMIESDDDKLTMLAQQFDNENSYFPQPAGLAKIPFLGWITAQTGGIRTSIDSLNVTAIPAAALPLAILVSIGDDAEQWKLRPMTGGDPTATSLPFYIVPITNPNSLIWVSI